jgi:hypothetical protein
VITNAVGVEDGDLVGQFLDGVGLLLGGVGRVEPHDDEGLVADEFVLGQVAGLEAVFHRVGVQLVLHGNVLSSSGCGSTMSSHSNPNWFASASF